MTQDEIAQINPNDYPTDDVDLVRSVAIKCLQLMNHPRKDENFTLIPGDIHIIHSSARHLLTGFGEWYIKVFLWGESSYYLIQFPIWYLDDSEFEAYATPDILRGVIQPIGGKEEITKLILAIAKQCLMLQSHPCGWEENLTVGYYCYYKPTISNGYYIFVHLEGSKRYLDGIVVEFPMRFLSDVALKEEAIRPSDITISEVYTRHITTDPDDVTLPTPTTDPQVGEPGLLYWDNQDTPADEDDVDYTIYDIVNALAKCTYRKDCSNCKLNSGTTACTISAHELAAAINPILKDYLSVTKKEGVVNNG